MADASAYVELLNRLLGARRFGMKLGIDRIRALLDQLGAPDRRLGTVVHVAGTNGKGSTVAILAALCPSEAEKAGAQRMVEAFETARARGEERALVDGLWVEVPTYLNAKRLLAQP